MVLDKQKTKQNKKNKTKQKKNLVRQSLLSKSAKIGSSSGAIVFIAEAVCPRRLSLVFWGVSLEGGSPLSLLGLPVLSLCGRKCVKGLVPSSVSSVP